MSLPSVLLRKLEKSMAAICLVVHLGAVVKMVVVDSSVLN